MSAYDYLTGAVNDPYDNVGKVRKFGRRATGEANPQANRIHSSMGDLIGQDGMYAAAANQIAAQYQTPGPIPSYKGSAPYD